MSIGFLYTHNEEMECEIKDIIYISMLQKEILRHKSMKTEDL